MHAKIMPTYSYQTIYNAIQYVSDSIQSTNQKISKLFEKTSKAFSYYKTKALPEAKKHSTSLLHKIDTAIYEFVSNTKFHFTTCDKGKKLESHWEKIRSEKAPKEAPTVTKGIKQVAYSIFRVLIPTLIINLVNTELKVPITKHAAHFKKFSKADFFQGFRSFGQSKIIIYGGSIIVDLLRRSQSQQKSTNKSSKKNHKKAETEQRTSVIRRKKICYMYTSTATKRRGKRKVAI